MIKNQRTMPNDLEKNCRALPMYWRDPINLPQILETLRALRTSSYDFLLASSGYKKAIKAFRHQKITHEQCIMILNLSVFKAKDYLWLLDQPVNEASDFVFQTLSDENTDPSLLEKIILGSYYKQDNLKQIEQFIHLPCASKVFIWQQCFVLACKNMDPILLDMIETHAPESFHHFIQAYNNKGVVDKIKNLSNPQLFSKHMKAFSTDFGHITYEDALLRLAATQKIKHYSFYPIVIQNEHEWKLFLSTIKQHKDKFLGQQLNIAFSGAHWVCASLFIDNQENTHILFIDPAGGYHTLRTKIQAYIKQLEASEDTPGASIFISEGSMQSTERGCSIFTLDTLRHLFTIDAYLPEVKPGDFPLLEYVKHHKTPDQQSTLGYMVNLPLLLMRTAQTRKHLQEIQQHHTPDELASVAQTKKNISSDEALWPVNHGKKTVFSSFEHDFVFDDVRNKMLNKRIERKFSKMRDEVYDYLSTEQRDVILNTMYAFTLDGFTHRLANPNPTPVHQHEEKAVQNMATHYKHALDDLTENTPSKDEPYDATPDYK